MNASALVPTKVSKEAEVAGDRINLNFIGRNGGKHLLPNMDINMSITELKTVIWMNLHEQLADDKPMKEKEFLDQHRLRIRGGRILEDETLTLSDHDLRNNMTIMMVLGLGGGMPGRRRITYEASDMATKDGDAPEVVTLLTSFGNEWTLDTFEQFFSDPSVSVTTLENIRDAVKGKSGTTDDKAMRVLGFVPAYSTLAVWRGG